MVDSRQNAREMVPETGHGTATGNSDTELSPNVPPPATTAVPGISQAGQAATEAADEPTAPSPVHAPSPPESIIEADDLVRLAIPPQALLCANQHQSAADSGYDTDVLLSGSCSTSHKLTHRRVSPTVRCPSPPQSSSSSTSMATATIGNPKRCCQTTNSNRTDSISNTIYSGCCSMEG